MCSSNSSGHFQGIEEINFFTSALLRELGMLSSASKAG